MIGDLRSKESTRKLQQFLPRSDARILNITDSEQWERLFVSVNYAVLTLSPWTVARPNVRVGVDLGLQALESVSDTDGNIIEFLNPAPF